MQRRACSLAQLLVVRLLECLQGPCVRKIHHQHLRTCQSSYTVCGADSAPCAVSGPLIVMRVRAAKASDSMGTKVVSVLKRYLKYTQSQQIQWLHSEGREGQHPWQLFEVIGDFGKNDQTEVMQKLSELAKHRYALSCQAFHCEPPTHAAETHCMELNTALSILFQVSCSMCSMSDT